MGLLDSVLGAAQQALNGAGGTNPGGNGDLLTAAIGLLQGNEGGGGLSGLVTAFQQGGMGNVIQSWIGTGQNLPISAEQLQSVLGSETVSKLAAQVGLDPAQVSQHLSQLLPQLVDNATPGGEMPQGGLGSLAQLASQFLSQRAG